MTTTIHRTDKGGQHAHPYTRIDNRVINDTKMTPLARLAVVYLLSKPDDWELRETDLRRYLEVGTGKLKTILAELRRAGYLNNRARYRDPITRQFTTGASMLYESPALNPQHNGTATTQNPATAAQPAQQQQQQQNESPLELFSRLTRIPKARLNSAVTDFLSNYGIEGIPHWQDALRGAVNAIEFSDKLKPFRVNDVRDTFYKMLDVEVDYDVNIVDGKAEYHIKEIVMEYGATFTYDDAPDWFRSSAESWVKKDILNEHGIARVNQKCVN